MSLIGAYNIAGCYLIMVAGTGGLSKVNVQMIILLTREYTNSARRQVIRVAPRCRHLATRRHRRTTSGSGLLGDARPPHDGLIDPRLVDQMAGNWSESAVDQRGKV